MEFYNWRETLAELDREVRDENKSLKNRLMSIVYDNEFINYGIIPRFPLPLIPNERCGVWYCDPDTYKQTCYFKSTDGHTDQWDFSTKRLNFHLLNTIAEYEGVTIIDSTRRGKKIPDALSKTIPIWAAVLNYIMLEKIGKSFEVEDVLFVPPGTVSKNEYNSICKKLPSLVDKLKALDVFDAEKWHKMVNGRILRPMWVCPPSFILEENIETNIEDPNEHKNKLLEEGFEPLLLCLVTVSGQAQDGTQKMDGFTYVQGAADDHELWSDGLTAEMFWRRFEFFSDIRNSDKALHTAVENMVMMEKMKHSEPDNMDEVFLHRHQMTEALTLGLAMGGSRIGNKIYEQLKENYDQVILFCNDITLKLSDELIADGIIEIRNMPSLSKTSSRNLRKKLPELYESVHSTIANSGKTLLACNLGGDISAAVLLAVLVKDYSVDWEFEPEVEHPANKIIIKKHLAKMASKMNGRNPNVNRTTLNSVNDFLM
ncbi:hypothetical protein C6P45_001173 [Maudiozyma exigua]|uniref:Initiator tRNA phosphoribosyl transferase n=1 Tax=Maudiozyma exigua TaxID=34358 RepID=A0A9P6WED0_MAUEX|nr:hypothetical protein C6P45_001173 [Kazachstania exigua]